MQRFIFCLQETPFNDPIAYLLTANLIYLPSKVNYSTELSRWRPRP